MPLDASFQKTHFIEYFPITTMFTDLIAMFVEIVFLPFFRIYSWFRNFLKIDAFTFHLRNAHWKSKLSSFGKNSMIYPSVIIHGPKNVTIGDRSSIAEFSHIWGQEGVSIGNDVLIASHVVITTLSHDSDAAVFRESIVRARVRIEDNVWIGAGSIILPGITIGSGSIVGAGSVVTKSVPKNTMVAGVPARNLR